jgi:hypothetical protein
MLFMMSIILMGCETKESSFGNPWSNSTDSSGGGQKKWCKLSQITYETSVQNCSWLMNTQDCTAEQSDGSIYVSTTTYNDYGYATRSISGIEGQPNTVTNTTYDCRDFYGTGIWCAVLESDSETELSETSIRQSSSSCTLDGKTQTCIDIADGITTRVFNNYGSETSYEFTVEYTDSSDDTVTILSESTRIYNCDDRANARPDLRCKILEVQINYHRTTIGIDTGSSEEYDSNYDKQCTWEGESNSCTTETVVDGEVTTVETTSIYNQFGSIVESEYDGITNEYTYTNCE